MTIFTLKGKKILFISPKFFNYETEICKKLKSYGTEVDFFDDRPKNSFLFKVLVRINRHFCKNEIHKYYNKILKSTKNKKYDYILFIKVESADTIIFEQFKKYHPTSIYILYLWDSINNNKYIESLFHFFDKIYSFDKKDTEKYDFIIFRPLFYLDTYCKTPNNTADVDFAFVGTIHSNRLKILRKVMEFAKENNLNCHFYMYIQHKFIYYIKRLFLTEFHGMQKKDFHFTPLSKTEVVSLLSQAKVIVDIEHPNQIGLTMRTIEILGMNKKLITTNQNVKNYDFYNPVNIQVINRNSLNINKTFINSKYEKISDDLYYKYSINGWILDIFSNIKS